MNQNMPALNSSVKTTASRMLGEVGCYRGKKNKQTYFPPIPLAGILSPNKIRNNEGRPCPSNCLVSLFQWHINLRGLFNAKSILVAEQQ